MLNSFVKKLPVISGLVAQRDALIKACGNWWPGHFYSPLVNVDEAKRDEQRIFAEFPRELPGIEMNEAGQLQLLSEFEKLYPSIDFPTTKTDGYRYYYENPGYSYSDAIMLHCMMRHFKPKQVTEVGSGYSSCAMLDTDERHLGHSVDFTFVEPYPETFDSLVRPEDKKSARLVQSRLQDVSVDTFARLNSGDFLFIDSTHCSKTGSDVNYLMFEILPALKSGVFLHVHDIFYPFEYPKSWVFGGHSWNEAYLLRAMLQFSSAFSIEMMNTFLQHFHQERFARNMPLCLKNPGGSIWLRKR